MVPTSSNPMGGLLVLAVVVVLGGCSKQLTASVEDRSAMSHGQAGLQAVDAGPRMPAGAQEEIRVTDLAIAAASASSASPQASEQPAEASQASSGLGDVFFDYDRFTLRMDAEPVLNLDARLLQAKNGTVVIAGHCDERGTAAYNLVLGEKRARSVKHYLEDLGIAPSRLRVISYGKEKPFCHDRGAGCWQNNRRAHLSIP